jgi:hypothetical protein
MGQSGGYGLVKMRESGGLWLDFLKVKYSKPTRAAVRRLSISPRRIALVEEGAAFFEAAEVVEDDRGGGRAIARVIDPIDPARHRARDQKTRDRY